ncbi:MAG: hypothetical protein ACI8X5_003460 [Planctomycetota bacterium]|jgi:hypothetical protein
MFILIGNAIPRRTLAFSSLLLGIASCQSPPTTDLLEGVEADGRIPKVQLPEDVPNPDRWRYKPEGRISEGNVVDRFLVSTFAAPVLFFSSDVGTGVGVSLTDIDFRNQRRQEFATSSFTYTTEGQQNYSFFWRRWLDHRNLPGGGVIQEERSFIQARVAYRKTLTRRFFGLGADSLEANETSYTDETASVDFGLSNSLPSAGSAWVVGLGARLEHRNLGEGFVSSVGDMQDVSPVLFDDGDDLDSIWFSADLRYDTRDSQSNPYRGTLLQLWGNGTPWMTDNRTGSRYGLRGSAILPLPGLFHDNGDSTEENPPTDRLAFLASVEDSTGDLPFWALPTLGGSRRLRGYVPGRFRDQAAWFSAVEYRIVVLPRGLAYNQRVRVERVGMALFYELGSVADGLNHLSDADVKSSYGLSGRINLERAATFRLDLGFAEDSTNWTITYGLSF